MNLKKTYDFYAYEREESEISEWKLIIRDKFLNLLKTENKKTLIELGAGHGRDSRFFIDNGIKVMAVDLSEKMVELCNNKGIEAYEFDFYHLSKLKKTFDAVWAMNSLLHVEKNKLEEVLIEIKKSLNENGLFFLGVYGGQDSEGIWESDYYEPKRFFSFYTNDKIKNILEKHFEIISFEDIETKTLNFQAFTLKNI
jgi:cyclopropane fatty-acyl-phospholipid synthase-like methyltransferase